MNPSPRTVAALGLTAAAVATATAALFTAGWLYAAGVWLEPLDEDDLWA